MDEVGMAILKEYTKIIAREINPRDMAIIQKIDSSDMSTIRHILEFHRDRFREIAHNQQGEERRFTMSRADSVQEVIQNLDRAD